MAYPSSIDTFANPAGTNTLSSPDHAADHNNLASAIQAVENTLGTTATSGIISGWSSGQVPIKSKGGTLQQEVIGGTLTTPTIAGGTANNLVMGSPAITGGTASNLVLGTPTITGVTYVRVKTGTTSFDISVNGAATVTGVGFQGKSIEVIALLNNTKSKSMAVSDGTSTFMRYEDEGGTAHGIDTNIVGLFTTYPTTAGAATFGGFTSDGFIYTSAKVGTPTGTALLIYKITG